jgi:ATP-binding cassette subfamily G (WHITE) protein 2 (SNQ2)
LNYVAFRDFGVKGIGSRASASYQPTLGSVLNPFTIIEEIKNPRHPPLKDISVDLPGVVKPGEMLRESYYLPLQFYLFLTVANNLQVVLGSPGAGCSPLLKTMANHTSEYHSVGGLRCPILP